MHASSCVLRLSLEVYPELNEEENTDQYIPKS